MDARQCFCWSFLCARVGFLSAMNNSGVLDKRRIDQADGQLERQITYEERERRDKRKVCQKERQIVYGELERETNIKSVRKRDIINGECQKDGFTKNMLEKSTRRKKHKKKNTIH